MQFGHPYGFSGELLGKFWRKYYYLWKEGEVKIKCLALINSIKQKLLQVSNNGITFLKKLYIQC